MIEVLLFLIVIMIISFSFVCFFGSPYLPTRRVWANEALSLVDLDNNDVVIDLGAGDGKILQLLAEKKIKSIGYEINPILVIVAKLRLFRHKYARIKMKNYWQTKLPNDATMVYAFMVERDAEKLKRYLREQLKDIKANELKLITFGFRLPNQKVIRQKNGSFLYIIK